jgi:heptosyltransferase-2
MKKAVIVLPNWVGDFVMSLSSLWGALEQERILLLGPAAFYSLIEGKVPSENYLPLTKKGKKTLLQGARYLFCCDEADRAVLLTNSFRSALMCLLGGVPRTWGLPTDGRSFLLHRKVPSLKDAHQSEIYRHIIDCAGLYIPWVGASIFPSAMAKQRIYEWWKKEKLAGEKVAVIHPFSSKEPRTWLPSRFKQIVLRLLKEDVRVVLLGSPKERKNAQSILDGVRGVLDLTCCDFGLGELAVLLGGCSLFVGNDSGPGHLAAAVGTPTITIHGSTAPHITGPRGGKALYIWKSLPCSPCKERFFKECAPGQERRPPCMEAITVEDVWRKVEKALNKPQSDLSIK